MGEKTICPEVQEKMVQDISKNTLKRHPIQNLNEKFIPSTEKLNNY